MKYDVIIIGGGLSGLTAGIIAAKRGKKTLLLEKHVTTGGLAAGFTKRGYYFDSGMSRVMGASVRESLKGLKILEKADLKPHRVIWNVEGNWIEYKQLNLFFEGLARLFPEEIDAFRAFYEKEDEVDYRGNMSIVSKAGKWYTQMFNVYPSSGFQGLADVMAGAFKEHGGELRTAAAVRKIIITNGTAVGVELGRNEAIETLSADRIICCIDLNKAFRDLIGIQHIDADLVSRLDRSQLSSPIPILFLGLNIPMSRLKDYFHGYDEIFYFPAIEPGKDEKNFYSDHPIVMHCSGFLAPSHVPVNKSSLQIYLSDPGNGWMDNWGIKDGKRTDEYKNIKKMVIEQVLEMLEKIVPELSDRSLIEVCELGTPFTIELYTGNTHGSGLGYSMDKDFINSKKFGKYFDHFEGIKNLFFAGQQTGYPGSVINAFGSGKHAGKLV